MEVDRAGWSGDGEFVGRLLERLREIDGVAYVRVEDAPATRSAADYQFLSTELFVRFATTPRWTIRRLGIVPWPQRVAEPVMTLGGLEAALTATADIGSPDYADGSMLQYLRTERIVAPYQTRGFKMVELVRVYKLG